MARDERDPAGVGARRTVRQQIRGLLLREPLAYHTLRALLGLTVRQLEDDLRHVERTARANGERLVVEPPACRACGFAFRDRSARHFHPPARCPQCRSERIEDPIFHIEPQTKRKNPLPP
jgi:predicted Zn-ribbon and HTH transcriptional regulator